MTDAAASFWPSLHVLDAPGSVVLGGIHVHVSDASPVAVEGERVHGRWLAMVQASGGAPSLRPPYPRRLVTAWGAAELLVCDSVVVGVIGDGETVVGNVDSSAPRRVMLAAPLGALTHLSRRAPDAPAVDLAAGAHGRLRCGPVLATGGTGGWDPRIRDITAIVDALLAVAVAPRLAALEARRVELVDARAARWTPDDGGELLWLGAALDLARDTGAGADTDVLLRDIA